jgi:hypothetical protein
MDSIVSCSLHIDIFEYLSDGILMELVSFLPSHRIRYEAATCRGFGEGSELNLVRSASRG